MDKQYYADIKKSFSGWANKYDILTAPISGVRNTVVDFVNAKSGSRVLDVCTGTGIQAFAFAKKGYDTYGIDLSEDMLKVAKRKNKHQNVKFEIADASDIPFEDNYFDASCVSFALHCMPLFIREKVLEEMVRVTKPKGIIVIVDFDLPRNRIGRYLTYHIIKSFESKHYKEFVKSDIRVLLGKSGIEMEKKRSIMFGTGRIVKGISKDIDIQFRKG